MQQVSDDGLVVRGRAVWVGGEGVVSEWGGV